MKYVLLTGSSGALGRAITKKLLKNKYFVLGLDLKKIKNNKNFLNFSCDISDESQIKEILKKLLIKIFYLLY